MIKIQNLTKRFNNGALTALDDISCVIENNKITGFIGPDGAGKTTLLRIMAGILTPDTGSIEIDGQLLDIYEQNDGVQLPKYQDTISYMPQKFGLYEDLTVIENLELYAKLQCMDDNKKKVAFDKVLEMTKLANFTKRLAGNLSGGMKQKLGLACALLKKPKILILDEPSVGVDPISRRDLIEMVNSMLDEDTTVLWSTAYLDEAEKLDHVVLLNEGKIIFQGSPKEAIEDVKNKVFILKDISENKRIILSKLLKIDGVIDTVILGNHIKFLTNGCNIRDICYHIRTKLKMSQEPQKIEPIFEDACIDILGGVQEKESPIFQYFDDVNFFSDKNVVEAINLTKRFGNFVAVDNVSFAVKPGKIFGLLGPNGSGKSTTFRMLCGLLQKNSGTAKIVGVDIAQICSNAKMNIGYMAQKFSLYSMLSVRQNLDFFSGIYGLTGDKQKYAVQKMIDMFHFEKLQNIKAGVLPLGFKQRLALACSIMHKPPVLFLDEPTSGVDPITRKEFWMHINALVSCGTSVVVTTHFMDEAENCDEIALVYRGKIRALGTPDDLKNVCDSDKNPTLEKAFIKIVETVDKNGHTL